MPFYEATDHARHRSSTIRESKSMDQVRHCTGEMFQPTRLKGQLTFSCLATVVVPLSYPVHPSAYSLSVSSTLSLFPLARIALSSRLFCSLSHIFLLFTSKQLCCFLFLFLFLLHEYNDVRDVYDVKRKVMRKEGYLTSI